MKKNVWAVLAFLMAWLGQAQGFELGKVTKEELQQTAHPLEPDAPAAILFESGKHYMEFSEQQGFMLITEVDIRIKIYKKDGYSWANRAIDYYIGQNPPEKINISKAFTYNLVNGSIEKTKLKSEGEFDEKPNKYTGVKKITMPNVKEGSVIEYRYQITSPYLSNIPEWQFQTSIPVNYSKYETRFPEFYIFKTNFKGYIAPNRTASSQIRNYSLTSKERNWSAQTSFSSNQFTFSDNITTYVAEKMPSMKDESYVNNIQNYISTIEHELSMIKYPNETKVLSMTWEDLAKSIYNSPDFGEELKKSNYFEDDIKTLLAGVTSSEEKAARIFAHVRNKMNWNGYNGYTCDQGVRKAYKDNVGNAAEINLMLTAMMRYAGLSANPVLVSTRANGIALFPGRSAYNYVICALEVQEGLILFDATDKYALPNMLPVRALNWSGRLIRENLSSTQVNLMPRKLSKDIVNMMASLDSQGKLTGKVREQYFDYNAMLYRQNYLKASKENYLEKLEAKYAGLEISDDFSVAADDPSKPVVESFSFTHPGVCEIIGERIYFSPFVFFTAKENPFKQDKREYPVDFVFPNQDKYMFTINLPEGYAVESVPAPLAVAFGEESGKFMFNISANEKQVQIVSSVEITDAIVSPDDYPALKDFFKAMIDKQQEKIVLKKI